MNTYNFSNLKSLSTSHKVAVGLRGARIIIKDKAEANAKLGLVSQYVELPVVTENACRLFMNKPEGMLLVSDMIESLQEKVARAIYASGKKFVSEFDLEIDKLIAIGTEASTSRLTKEGIGTWFDSKVEKLVEYLIESRGIEIEVAKKIASNYRPLFVSLAGREVSFDDGIKEKLELVLIAIAVENDAMDDRIIDKLSGAKLRSIDSLAL